MKKTEEFLFLLKIVNYINPNSKNNNTWAEYIFLSLVLLHAKLPGNNFKL